MVSNKKVLFIAHRIMGKQVGTLRIRYWVNNIFEQSGQSINCDLLTSDEQVKVNESVDKTYCAPDNDTGGLLRFIIKDVGLTWKHAIKRELEIRPDLKYDAIVLTGGPFMQFALVPYLKERFKAKVILDFRDPFAVNPRFYSSAFKILIKRYFERKFIKAADCVITVNAACLQLLSTYSVDNSGKFSIIGNGFDDKVIDQLVLHKQNIAKGELRFVYPGQIYGDCNPATFLRILCQEQAGVTGFEYAGPNGQLLKEFKMSTNIKINEPLSYHETLEMIDRANIGLIFTGGRPFESTTKIFDYIGLEKAILIITEGEVETGELHEITRKYPKVFWSRNTKLEISRVLDKLKNEDLNFSNSMVAEHSRENGLAKLIDLIHGE